MNISIRLPADFGASDHQCAARERMALERPEEQRLRLCLWSMRPGQDTYYRHIATAIEARKG